jgi:hypothetical protein
MAQSGTWLIRGRRFVVLVAGRASFPLSAALAALVSSVLSPRDRPCKHSLIRHSQVFRTRPLSNLRAGAQAICTNGFVRPGDRRCHHVDKLKPKSYETSIQNVLSRQSFWIQNPFFLTLISWQANQELFTAGRK